MCEESREYITPEIERRQYRRAKLVAQVRCDLLSREDLLVTRDVSMGGVFIDAESPLPPDSEVTLSFCLESSQPPIACRGNVIYCLPGLGMAIRFLDLSEESRQAIQKFVDESS